MPAKPSVYPGPPWPPSPSPSLSPPPVPTCCGACWLTATAFACACCSPSLSGCWRRWRYYSVHSTARNARFPDTIATLDASPVQLFPLFNTREGHRRAWTLASERAGGNVPPMTHGDLGGPPGGVGTRTLGLVSCKTIIEQHQGTIQAANTESGALFTIMLPKN